MESQNTPNPLNRRKWLRDTALAATSVAVVPSMLIGCSDRRIPPSLGVGPGLGGMEDVPLTSAELAIAAQNLSNMDAFFADVHTYNIDYERSVHEWLKSSPENPPSGFSQFILSLITAIVIGIMGVVVAAAVVTPGVGPIIAATVGAAIAIVSLNIKTWALDGNSRPQTLEAQFAKFDDSQNKMRKAMSDLLIDLASSTDNYRNLRENWKDVEFNGIKYTLRHLASSTFPTKSGSANPSANPTKIEDTPYVLMRTAATEHFKRQIWNVMIAKAGSLSYGGWWHENVDDYDKKPPFHYAREIFYKRADNKGRYLRGYYNEVPLPYGGVNRRFTFGSWTFTFDNRPLSADAANELFIDDTPGHIMDPDDKGNPKTGFFNRDYVFKQFHQEKKYMTPFLDLREDEDWGRGDKGDNGGYGSYGFDPDSNNYVFTGGEFPPQLTKPK